MEPEKTQTSGVVRTIAILESLAHCTSINLEQLSKQTKLPKATLLRFLNTLIGLGYVYRDPADQYSLTLKMFSVGSHGLEHIDLIGLANPVAQKLCDSLGETVHMGILEGNHAVYVLKKESSYTIRMYSRVGKSIPLYCTGIGKVFLASMTEEELQRYLSSTILKPYTPHTIRDAESLRKELELVRQRGWATDEEEHEIGTLCIASPVKDYTGKTVAAMSVTWPLFRFNRAEQDRITKAITTECGHLSKLLGYEAPNPA
ncbi:MAG: IclR family transcriptional regulator [Sphaerochaeta sp.]|jgi:IclR family KDG regulon transcriptional repressor|nr:IclR family transcriptional regulator [Sphaerochaeta sp.]MCH3919646.1 IclR family transcriptional regulator [Sphaerochaeta sp.]MCI2044824.1 IclR family transcriptional regulator [Sphaerochaeta sp.]MCI2104690.1 IclR family transcriptional regulator [Sphaerochaeta sp.]MCI2128203.1 IclR family transcriptional regulator [Sphaerochaeta sp.]